jgi:hypothetical protein
MFHLTRLLQSCKTWRRGYAVRACVLGLSLACALALYFLSPVLRQNLITTPNASHWSHITPVNMLYSVFPSY